ncbi:MAG: hypothetical protein LBF75_00740 [Treponema sp.]|jgi:hypothetical protein|nr:hypothetical protein [Treponema sp.]
MFYKNSYLDDELVNLLNQLSPQGQSTALALIRTILEQEQTLALPGGMPETAPEAESEPEFAGKKLA